MLSSQATDCNRKLGQGHIVTFAQTKVFCPIKTIAKIWRKKAIKSHKSKQGLPNPRSVTVAISLFPLDIITQNRQGGSDSSQSEEAVRAPSRQMRTPKNYSPPPKNVMVEEGVHFFLSLRAQRESKLRVLLLQMKRPCYFFFSLLVQPCFWYLRHSPLGCACWSNFSHFPRREFSARIF
ncbi:hypothetical protein CDAR_27631 [Caerostris darwini]|uniref:Uncharacterized protein n=1 Tax=Caerostris darwini TaxID=1538125 RepID=A0AAV4SPP4_9ARAC|nr:hypothetical protein CDAR_27631 [Caerostris darwini]